LTESLGFKKLLAHIRLESLTHDSNRLLLRRKEWILSMRIQTEWNRPCGMSCRSRILWAVPGLLVALCLLWGCGQESPGVDPPVSVAAQPESLPTPADPLTVDDLENFLAIVPKLPGGRVPDFSPGDDHEIDELLPAAQLIDAYRAQFRRTFDPNRQGRLWARDKELVQVFDAQKTTAAQFASLVARISCTITAGALAGQADIGGNVARGEQQLQRLTARIQGIDAKSQSAEQRGESYERSQAVAQLRSTVALLEFITLLRSVPGENQKLVRKYQHRLQEFIPQVGGEGIFEAFEDQAADAVQPAGYER
jgi:hypothetical protein